MDISQAYFVIGIIATTLFFIVTGVKFSIVDFVLLTFLWPLWTICWAVLEAIEHIDSPPKSFLIPLKGQAWPSTSMPIQSQQPSISSSDGPSPCGPFPFWAHTYSPVLSSGEYYSYSHQWYSYGLSGLWQGSPVSLISMLRNLSLKPQQGTSLSQWNDALTQAPAG